MGIDYTKPSDVLHTVQREFDYFNEDTARRVASQLLEAYGAGCRDKPKPRVKSPVKPNYNATKEDLKKLVRAEFPQLSAPRMWAFADMLSDAFDQGFGEAFEIGTAAVDAQREAGEDGCKEEAPP